MLHAIYVGLSSIENLAVCILAEPEPGNLPRIIIPHSANFFLNEKVRCKQFEWANDTKKPPRLL